ncbi:MAG: hypothetical protein KKB50_16775 [Planctomycetes bacterium]|nr:hypothetical protein [Planctomycetota bacterium]
MRRPEVRTRVLSLVDAGNIINVLPKEAQVEQAIYTMSPENRLVVTDKATFTLDINEFGARC